METEWTPETLLAFEEDIAQEFAAGKINAPIHLGGGNEQQLIDIFKDIKSWDWVLCAWRSHYHCLLKGVPADQLKAKIMAGHSVGLCFPGHRVLSSGIVGGIAPIAVGLGWAASQPHDETVSTIVHCFIGDMTAESGIVHECMKYAGRHRLPIRWVVEDNGLSVCTNTQESWGPWGPESNVHKYEYTLSRPHSGIGKWVRF